MHIVADLVDAERTTIGVKLVCELTAASFRILGCRGCFESECFRTSFSHPSVSLSRFVDVGVCVGKEAVCSWRPVDLWLYGRCGEIIVITVNYYYGESFRHYSIRPTEYFEGVSIAGIIYGIYVDV